jgi:Stress responsive A/B Barrel Domain
MKRKAFIQTTAMGAIGALVLPKINEDHMQKNLFVHHVYFWLKEPQSKEAREKLIQGLEKLSKVKTIQMFHIGMPADTNREVIDRSYAISWLCLFKNKEDQDAYQVDPIHLKFVEECANLWTRVVVYDSIDVK